MTPDCKIVQIIRARQSAMRRMMDERGISMKVVAFDSGLEYRTLLSYFPEAADKQPVQIPGSAIFALTGHVPADIMSLLLPSGHVIVRAPEALDHDQMAEAMQDYLRVKERAHHPDSPAGRDIAPCEDNVLCVEFAKVSAVRAA